MNTKRILTSIVAIVALTLMAYAQNMTQMQANEFLTGTWRVNGEILLINADGNTHTANIFGEDFNNWSIYTNTFDFSSGSLQATNSEPLRNITIKYRNLTRSSCEFLIDGNWVKVSRAGGVKKPSINTVQRPVINNNKKQGSILNGKNPQSAKPSIRKPENLNSRVLRPNTDKGSHRTLNNGKNRVEIKKEKSTQTDNATNIRQEDTPIIIN